KRSYSPFSGQMQADTVPASASLKVCAVFLALLAVGLAVGFVASGWSLGNVGVVFALSLVAAVAQRGRVRVGDRFEASISLVPTLLAAVLFGPLAGMLVSAVALVDHFRRPFLKWVTYTSTSAIAGAAAGLAAAAVSDAYSRGL